MKQKALRDLNSLFTNMSDILHTRNGLLGLLFGCLNDFFFLGCLRNVRVKWVEEKLPPGIVGQCSTIKMGGRRIVYTFVLKPSPGYETESRDIVEIL